MEAVLDRTLDVDGHEMSPCQKWGEVFGEAGARIAELTEPMLRRLGDQNFSNPDLEGDLEEITPETVWNVRGTDAPGAFDFSRRLRVMDEMGIEKQLIFPSFALVVMPLMSPETPARSFLRSIGVDLSDEELVALGRAGLNECNAWAARTTAIDRDRLRPVAYLPHCETPEALVEEATSLLASGVRALHVSHGVPLGGRSPAHPDLDPFWDLFGHHNAICVTHVGGEPGFMVSAEWKNAPAFAPGKVESHEIGLEPYSFATLHLAICNFLACMLLGGVFERHPDLRFGALELGSSWLGPLADMYDMWARDMYSVRLKPFISKLPSEYLRSNVRVTPFSEVDPIERQLAQYPHLLECYCYSTDYPHIEGGKDVKRRLLERISPLGPDVVQKYFVENAQLLFPT